MTASKLHSTTNLLNSGAMHATKNRFELPLLSNRSASKPSLVQQRNQMSHSKDPAKVTQASGTQSHNFLPSKIGCGIMSQQPLGKPGAQQTSTPSSALLM